jgi:hypothetical protein
LWRGREGVLTKQITSSHREITYSITNRSYRVSFTKEGKRITYQVSRKKGKVRLLLRGSIDGVPRI